MEACRRGRTECPCRWGDFDVGRTDDPQDVGGRFTEDAVNDAVVDVATDKTVTGTEHDTDAVGDCVLVVIVSV